MNTWTDDCLYKQAFLSNVPQPDEYDLEFFRNWLRRPNMGNFPLRGLDRHTWSEAHEADFIAVQSRKTTDMLSHWFLYTVVPYFHRKLGHRIKVCFTKWNGYAVYTGSCLVSLAYPGGNSLTTTPSLMPLETRFRRSHFWDMPILRCETSSLPRHLRHHDCVRSSDIVDCDSLLHI